MAKCSFCGDEVIRGTGKIYVKKEGTMFRFCSSKCEKNLVKLERNPQYTRWTQAFSKYKETTGGTKKK